MGNLNSEGALYFHMITFSFLFSIVVAFKNADLNDFGASPDLTSAQVTAIAASLVIGSLLALFFLVIRGATIKNPPFGRLGSVGLALVLAGVLSLFWTLGLDAFTGGDASLGADRALMVMLFSLLPIIGTYMVVAAKFSTTRQDEAISRMVREELQKAVASNNVVCPGCHKVINAYAAVCKFCGMDFSEPEPEAEDVLIAIGPSPEDLKGTAGEAKAPAPAPADQSVIFNCSKCSKKLKISNPKRPLTIRCPNCKSVETLTE